MKQDINKARMDAYGETTEAGALTQKKEASFVYFVKHGDATIADLRDGWWDRSTYVKIGKATHCATRLAGLQCGNPIKLTFLGCMRGGEKEERELHKFLHAYRASGEWFRYTINVARYIDNLHLFNVEGKERCDPEETNKLDNSEDGDGVALKDTPGMDRFTLGCDCTWGVERMLGEVERGWRRPTCCEPSEENIDLMERLFRNKITTPKANRFHIDIFNNPIWEGQLYYRICPHPFDPAWKLSEKSASTILNIFFGARSEAAVPARRRKPLFKQDNTVIV